MNGSRGLSLVSLIAAILACVLAVMSWRDARRHVAEAHAAGPSGGGWLKGTAEERFSQVETQLRGLDNTMVEVGYRFGELFFAAKDRNWEYARYQAEKMDLAIRLGLERRPKRANSARFFLTDEIPAVLKAIESRDDKIVQNAMDRLRASCMKCHTLEEVPYFTVELPEHRLSSVRKAP